MMVVNSDAYTYVIASATPSRANSISPRGVRYTTLTSSGPKEEGDDYAETYATSDDAEMAYAGQLAKFLEGASIVVYRQEPELLHLSNGKWTVVSRLDAWDTFIE